MANDFGLKIGIEGEKESSVRENISFKIRAPTVTFTGLLGLLARLSL